MQINGLLTIGIPAYNGGDNLPGLLESIKNLDLPDNTYEILIVDNDSTDDTDYIISKLKLTFNNIRYYKNDTNIGRIENWNKVLELAFGEFLILMNVNDRFLNYDGPKYLAYLKDHSGISLVMNDVLFENYQYPHWASDGVVELNAYIKKTFLDIDYLEFHSLGVLQQHIFRTKIIREHNLKFDRKLPRTTDRVFVAQVIKYGGGKFFYTAHPVVSWRLSANRYHNQIHNNLTQFNFDQLWGNEYKANTEVAKIAEIPYTDILESQMVLARFLRFAKWVRLIKSKVFKQKLTDHGMEIPTAHLYYNHLKDMARLNNVSANYLAINILAFKRAVTWFFRSLKINDKKSRTIKDINY